MPSAGNAAISCRQNIHNPPTYCMKDTMLGAVIEGRGDVSCAQKPAILGVADIVQHAQATQGRNNRLKV
jgi:hypothetical protein